MVARFSLLQSRRLPRYNYRSDPYTQSWTNCHPQYRLPNHCCVACKFVRVPYGKCTDRPSIDWLVLQTLWSYATLTYRYFVCNTKAHFSSCNDSSSLCCICCLFRVATAPNYSVLFSEVCGVGIGFSVFFRRRVTIAWILSDVSI